MPHLVSIYFSISTLLHQQRKENKSRKTFNMHSTPTTILLLVICLYHVTCYAVIDSEVNGDEMKEIEATQDVLRTVEKRIVNKIHAKYARQQQQKQQQQRQVWGNLKSTLEGFVEMEKRKLQSSGDEHNRASKNHLRQNDGAPRIPHDELNDAPRIPHREINNARIVSLREIVNAPRIPHREMNDAPRIPHREIDDAPRIPHREIIQPRLAHYDAPRIPHRELNDSPRIPHREVRQQYLPRLPHKSESQRIPNSNNNNINFPFDFHQLKLSDLEKNLLREIASKSTSTSGKATGGNGIRDRELQGRSEGCISICMGVFDTCINTINSEELFPSCLEKKRDCINRNPVCV